MFDKKYRYSFKKGVPKKIFTSQFFVIRYEKNDSGLLCAVVVSKKVDKRAVVRNKIKRQVLLIIKEIVEEEIPYSLVVYIKKQILNIEQAQIKEEMLESFKKIKIVL